MTIAVDWDVNQQNIQIKTGFTVLNSLPASGDFCHLLKFFVREAWRSGVRKTYSRNWETICSLNIKPGLNTRVSLDPDQT